MSFQEAPESLWHGHTHVQSCLFSSPHTALQLMQHGFSGKHGYNAGHDGGYRSYLGVMGRLGKIGKGLEGTHGFDGLLSMADRRADGGHFPPQGGLRESESSPSKLTAFRHDSRRRGRDEKEDGEGEGEEMRNVCDWDACGGSSDSQENSRLEGGGKRSCLDRGLLESGFAPAGAGGLGGGATWSLQQMHHSARNLSSMDPFCRYTQLGSCGQSSSDGILQEHIQHINHDVHRLSIERHCHASRIPLPFASNAMPAASAELMGQVVKKGGQIPGQIGVVGGPGPVATISINTTYGGSNDKAWGPS